MGVGKNIKLYGTLYTPEQNTDVREEQEEIASTNDPEENKNEKETAENKNVKELKTTFRGNSPRPDRAECRICGIKLGQVQGDQLNMAVYFWYPIKNDLSSVQYMCKVP